jgi:hypothetical protein
MTDAAAAEHQRVQLGGDKAPFEGSGVMLLVLHRGADGKWRTKRDVRPGCRNPLTQNGQLAKAPALRL